ncbi:hypothetical protein D3981_003032 [Escherichia coli]|nr:hypothetical protein [Escherichia coli]
MGELIIKNEVERVERFYSLQAGQYWSALESIPDEAIEAGDTLLIQSVRYVESKLHTVILRAHPRFYGQTIGIPYVNSNGDRNERAKKMTEHRFLAQDFLNRFEYQPDHEKIRESELKLVQHEVARLQGELTNLVSSPMALRQLAIAQLEEEERSKSDGKADKGDALMLPAQVNEIATMAVGTVQNALTAGLTQTRIEQIRDAAKQEGRISDVISQTISRRSKDITLAIQQMTPYYEELGAAMIATSEESRNHVQKIQDGVGSLELYIGKDVEVTTICTGESAPAGIPLLVVQRKLMMDEELAVWAELDEWFDFSNIELFHKSLQKNQGLVDQIFPSERAIVCMATTRRNIDYRDSWTNHARNKQNKVVFLLVRDGQNIHQIYSPVESHLGAHQLFPSTSEQESHFRGIDGSTIKFEDVSYSDRLKAHDMMALHYRRFLILICGLDHRLKLFGQFYDSQTSHSFLSKEFQEEYFRFLHDNDGSGLLAAPETRLPLDAYIEQANSTLQSGSRVLCNWGEIMSPTTAPGAVQEDSNYSGQRRTAKVLKDYETVIAFRHGEHIQVNADAQRYSTGTNFKCKVNLSLYRPGRREDTQLGYLCMDSIKPEDLEWYINRRKFRSNHLFYIRFFKMALMFIRAEREEEEPFRKSLVQALVDGNIGTPESHEELVDKCVIAFRASNRGEPLSLAMATSKGKEELLNQLYQLGGAGAGKLPHIRAYIEQKGYKLIRVSVNATGKIIAYAAPAPHECDNRLEGFAWVHRMTLSVTIKGAVRENNRSWVKMSRFIAAENTLSEDEQLTAMWADKKTAFKSYQEKQRYFDLCSAGPDALRRFMDMSNPDVYTKLMTEWLSAYEALTETGSLIRVPEFMVPVAVERLKGKARLIYIGTKMTEVWFYKNAPTAELRETFLHEYLRMFEHRAEVKARLLENQSKPCDLSFYCMNEGDIRDEEFNSTRKSEFQPWTPGYFYSIPTMLNDQWSCHQAHFSLNGQLYLTPSLLGDDGEAEIDEYVNYPQPDGLQPVYVWEFEQSHFGKLAEDTEGKNVKMTHWFDVSQIDRDTEYVLGTIPSTALTIRKYKMDSLKQVRLYIEKGNVKGRDASDNEDWHQPPEGIIRIVKKAW